MWIFDSRLFLASFFPSNLESVVFFVSVLCSRLGCFSTSWHLFSRVNSFRHFASFVFLGRSLYLRVFSFRMWIFESRLYFASFFSSILNPSFSFLVGLWISLFFLPSCWYSTRVFAFVTFDIRPWSFSLLNSCLKEKNKLGHLSFMYPLYWKLNSFFLEIVNEVDREFCLWLSDVTALAIESIRIMLFWVVVPDEFLRKLR